MQSKHGKHGTLYAYRITYTCESDPIGFGHESITTWAYNRDHAIEKFNDHGFDQGWKIVSVGLRAE